MAITTLDGALAGMQPPVDFMKNLTGTLIAGQPRNLMYLSGYPGAMVAPAPGIGGAVLTSYAGQLPFTNPGAGNTYLARLEAAATIAGTLWLCDRLWHNSGMNVTLTSEQAFTGAARIPARDANGTNNGVGVYMALEVNATVGAGTPTVSIKYTNQAGTPGQVLAAANLVAIAASSLQGTFIPMGLAAGDTGIQLAESMTLSATMTSGAISAVLYRVIAKLEIPLAQSPAALDAITSGFPRMYDNTVPFLVFVPGTTTTSKLHGHCIWTQG